MCGIFAMADAIERRDSWESPTELQELNLRLQEICQKLLEIPRIR